jgi:hypothetical protein
MAVAIAHSLWVASPIVLLIALLFQWVLSEDTYLVDEAKWRSARNEMFKNSPESPIPDSLRAQFDSLTWFPVSRSFRVTADFEANPKFERIQMPRSQSTPETYIIAGWLRFKIGNVECKLTAYQPNPKDSKTLFVPFRDLTSGQSTYGGGRYIDTRRTEDKVPLGLQPRLQSLLRVQLRLCLPCSARRKPPSGHHRRWRKGFPLA